MATKAQLAALSATQSELSSSSRTVGSTSGLQKIGSVPQRRITIQARGREYQVLDPAYYELSPDQQSAYLDVLDERADQRKGEPLFDGTALAVMDIAQAQGKKVTQLERLVESLVGEVRELRQELSQRDQALEIQRSDSLVEAESQLAQTVVNAAAVEASLRNQTKESEVVHERQRLETQAQLESLAAPITARRCSLAVRLLSAMRLRSSSPRISSMNIAVWGFMSVVVITQHLQRICVPLPRP